ncbi:uncharacterized protein LOC133542096 isoform X2 [Nerophis ophidion]|nr:uncharacterized protein LOC133542096 isoform X2 [Nerophis ophidion]XP_061741927.1 uncharacterized protein LOC133542096 isoform X2 [Nerophis ophidion]
MEHQEECLPHLQGDSFTHPQPPYFKEEEEGECPVGQEEADVSKFPLTVVSVKTEEHEDKPPESSQLHHSPNVQQPSHIKEEEEEVWMSQEGECPVGQEEADVSKFPLTVVSVKTEEHEDKPPESSQLHHSPSPLLIPSRNGDKGSERLMTLHLHTSNVPVTLACEYGPTLMSTAEVKDAFYANLNDVIKNIPPKEHLIILGDFYARVLLTMTGLPVLDTSELARS